MRQVRNIVILLGILLSAQLSHSSPLVGPQKVFCPGRILIQARDGFTPSVRTLLPDVPFAKFKAYDSWGLAAIGKTASLSGVDKSAARDFFDNLYVLTFPDTVDVLSLVGKLKTQADLKYVEPDYRVELYGLPQDPLFPHQWFWRNTGQPYYAISRYEGSNNDSLYLATGKPGEDINMLPVYTSAPADNSQVIVAIIDTGIDYTHPDLKDNIYHNAQEIPGNGIDDDHNGLVDDYSGWDFSGEGSSVTNIVGDNDATDTTVGHGTHLAGLVAAEINTIGVAGYPGNIKILPIKIMPYGFASVATAAVVYAADMGAKVFNMSWGIAGESDILREAIDYAIAKGALPVAAAGNFADNRRTIPGAYPEVFTVGGTGSDGYLAYFTSFGPFVKIVAPARDILSLRAAGTDMYAASGEPGIHIIDTLYYLADGTSMASPIVAGAAAMLWSFHPGLSADRIIEALEQTADDLPDPFNRGDNLPGYDTLSGYGRLNVGRAFNYLMQPSAYLNAPIADQVVSGAVAVGVRTTGGYSGTLDLQLGVGEIPTTWTTIFHSGTAFDTDSLYVWNTQGLNGYYVLRLQSASGYNQVNVRVVNGQIAQILYPPDNSEVRYVVPVRGSASAPGYDSTRLSYRENSSSTWNRIFSTTRLLFADSICEWSVVDLPDADYILRLELFAGADVVIDSVRVHANSLMRPGFPIHLPGFAAFSPGVDDINGDGKKEIIIGCKHGLFAYSPDGQLLPGFPILTDHDMQSMPAFDDVDGDGLPDIIITGDNIIGCYNYRGQALSGWPRKASTGEAYFSYPIPVLSKLYDAADSVILYMSKYGEVRAYKYDGSSYFYSLDGLFTSLDPNIFDTSQYTGMAVPYLASADLDKTGANEIISIYSSSILPSGMYIWNGRNGLPPFGWQSPLARKIAYSYGGTMADINNDGRFEIIMAGNDSLQRIGIWVTEDGKVDMPGWPVYLDIPGDGNWLGTSPVCVDIDGNGTKEILIAFFDFNTGRIYAFNSDGTPYQRRGNNPPGLLISTQTSLSNIIVADVDGNGVANIISRGGQVFPGGYERIFAWEPDGTPTRNFPIVTPTSVVTSSFFTPVIDDLDDDGKAELVICGDDGDLFVWNLNVPYDSTAAQWTRFRGDLKNSGINHRLGNPTDVNDPSGPLPDRFAIVGNFPNPFNPTTTIAFSLDRAMDVHLDIFNILGQKVASLPTGKLPAGTYTRVWNGAGDDGQPVATGVYFARLIGDGRVSSRKMLLLK